MMGCGANKPHADATMTKNPVVLLTILAFTVSLSSAIAWKVSDVDFATKLGSERLSEAYVCTALVIFASSSLILSGLKWLTPQVVFLSVQRYAGLAFGLLACCETLFSLSRFSTMIFIFKVIGYAYSALVLNSFWIALNPYDEKSPVTTGQCTLYSLSTYVGMAVAGVLLQSDTLHAGQLGLLVAGCSVICWIIGSIAFGGDEILPSTPRPVEEPPRPSHSQTLWRAIFASRAVMTLVVGSVLLNVLVSSTEYYFIADFESRFLSLKDAPSGVQSIGSFVTLIGLGNILALFSWKLWHRHRIGRAGLPIAALFAVFMMRIGFTQSHSVISSVVTLLIVESLYPLVVESNMQYLLARFGESERVSARTLIDTVAEPAGLLLSAILLILPGFDIQALGIGVVFVALLLLLYSCSVDSAWRSRQLANFQHMLTSVPARCSTLLVIFPTFLPCVDIPYDLTEDLIEVDGYNWLYIPAVHWGD